MASVNLKIQNLKCGGCAHTITKQLNQINGISNVEVNNESHEVTFDFENEHQQHLAQEKLSQLGYPVESDDNSISKKAKSFISCAVGRMGSN